MAAEELRGLVLGGSPEDSEDTEDAEEEEEEEQDELEEDDDVLEEALSVDRGKCSLLKPRFQQFRLCHPYPETFSSICCRCR